MKFKIFNMIEYSKVVYLDVDIIVICSIEDFFECQGFCVNLKYFECLNLGVMVVEFLSSFFEDMILKVQMMYFYMGGD